MNPINRLSKLDKYTRYSVIIIVLFSIIILSLTSIYHVSGDGCWHASVGKYIWKNHEIPLFQPLGREEPFYAPPLYHMITAFVYSVFNIFSNDTANFAIKFVSPIFGIAALMLSFLTIKKLFNSKIAFYSILFLAFIPIFLDYSIFSYVESTMAFFVILSIYLMVNDKVAYSGIAAGLSILAKLNGAFVLPVLIFILYRKFGSKKAFYRNVVIVIGLSLLIASPWLLRNWMLLGNPIWPFLNFAFDGYEARSFSSFNLNNIIDPDLYAFTYMGIFGVPDGNYRTLAMVNLPYFRILFFIWMAGTFIFSFPFIAGIFNFKNIRKSFKSHDIGIVLALSYLILFFMYAANVGFSVSRMLLPAFPAFAMIWAFGFEKLAKGAFRKTAIFLLTAVIIGFVLTEFVKIKYASDSWNAFRPDFDWARQNTSPDAIFIAEGQCVPYNLERTSMYATEENINKADYVWINQDFNLDTRSILDEDKISLIKSENFRIAYSNDRTKTSIYQTTNQ